MRRLLFIALLWLAAPVPAASAQELVLEHVSDNPGTVTDANIGAFTPLISASGTRTFFTTDESLLPSDTDAVADVYARNADRTLSLLSDGPFTPDPALPADVVGAAADGSRVFIATKERLWQFTDSDAAYDVYAREADGSITEVSDHPTSSPDAAVDAYFGGSSADGSRVFFSTSESLVAGDTDIAGPDVYAHEPDGRVSLITGSPVNPDPEVVADYAGASADGSRVFFVSPESRATFADTDNYDDVYARNANGTLSLISDHPTTNPDADETAGYGGASADGTRVLFFTAEQMLASDSDAVTDVYARNADGTLSHVSDNPATSTDAALPALPHGASADGKRVLFDTAERMLSSDTDSAIDVYARNADGSLIHLSDHPTTTTDAANDVLFRASSADGSRVIFTTGERLLPSDTDAADDVYARNADGTLSHLSDNPRTAVDNGFDAQSVRASADGTRVAFRTDEPMLPSDTDNADDIYLVRPAPAPDPGPGGGPGGDTPASGTPGGPGTAGGGGAADLTVPVVGGLTMARAFRAAPSGGPIAAARATPIGTTVRYRLSEPATATFTVERPTVGRLVGRACRKPTRTKRTKRKCTRWARVGKPFTHRGTGGANSFRFTGRTGRKLSPGSYRLAVVAADTAGNKSARKSRAFKIARR
jgi:hypothetical protein